MWNVPAGWSAASTGSGAGPCETSAGSAPPPSAGHPLRTPHLQAQFTCHLSLYGSMFVYTRQVQETPNHLQADHPLCDSRFVTRIHSSCAVKPTRCAVRSRINLFSGMTVNTTGRICKPWRRGSDSQAPHKCLASLSVHFDSNSRSSVFRVRLLATRFLLLLKHTVYYEKNSSKQVYSSPK